MGCLILISENVEKDIMIIKKINLTDFLVNVMINAVWVADNKEDSFPPKI